MFLSEFRARVGVSKTKPKKEGGREIRAPTGDLNRLKHTRVHVYKTEDYSSRRPERLRNAQILRDFFQETKLFFYDRAHRASSLPRCFAETRR